MAQGEVSSNVVTIGIDEYAQFKVMRERIKTIKDETSQLRVINEELDEELTTLRMKYQQLQLSTKKQLEDMACQYQKTVAQYHDRIENQHMLYEQERLKRLQLSFDASLLMVHMQQKDSSTVDYQKIVEASKSVSGESEVTDSLVHSAVHVITSLPTGPTSPLVDDNKAMQQKINDVQVEPQISSVLPDKSIKKTIAEIEESKDEIEKTPIKRNEEKISTPHGPEEPVEINKKVISVKMTESNSPTKGDQQNLTTQPTEEKKSEQLDTSQNIELLQDEDIENDSDFILDYDLFVKVLTELCHKQSDPMKKKRCIRLGSVLMEYRRQLGYNIMKNTDPVQYELSHPILLNKVCEQLSEVERRHLMFHKRRKTAIFGSQSYIEYLGN